tara:strand:- start:22 stop:333 length:312 start_codon:yes stop_codon:yes gene_type:complete
MKLTKSKLKQIIKEELTKIVREEGEEEWKKGWYKRDEDWFEKGVMGRKIATARWYPDENKWKWDITIYRAAGPEDYDEDIVAAGEADTEERAKQLAHAAYKTA